MSVNRENINKKENEFSGGPEPGWDKMEKTAVETEKQATQWNKGMEGVSTEDHKPHGSEYIGGNVDAPPKSDELNVERNSDIVEQSGDLTRPVGTESDSY